MSTQPDSTPAATAEAPDKGVGCGDMVSPSGSPRKMPQLPPQFQAWLDRRVDVAAPTSPLSHMHTETQKDPAVIVAEGYYRLKAENETLRDSLANEIHERSRLYSALATLRNYHGLHNTAAIENFVDGILANTDYPTATLIIKPTTD